MQVVTHHKQQAKRAVGFEIKMAWLAISKMYNVASAEAHEAYIGSEIAKKHGMDNPGAGITTNMGFVLLHIDPEEGTPSTKIASLMGMEPGSLTRMVKKMEKDGFIYRQNDPKDGRIARIFPTEKGLHVRAIAREVVINFNKTLAAHIPEEKLNTFFEVIDDIHDILQNRINHDS
ncbi:MAG: MarR family winged helix-turn-helix transcriptional regulator [Bacteroidia bacterium]